MIKLLTKENKTGWKEVDFLTEALSPSPTPLKKRKEVNGAKILI